MNGTWREAKDRKIRLPDIEACHLERYIQWLYTGAISIQPEAEVINMQNDRDEMQLSRTKYAILMDLYIMGHFLLDSAFRNAVVPEYRHRFVPRIHRRGHHVTWHTFYSSNMGQNA